MATITKQSNGRWRARYRDDGGKEHARHFVRKADAQSWIDSITTAMRTGSYVDPGRAKVTVAVMADQWLAGKINIRPTTRVRYESALHAHVLPRWADTPLDRIDHGTVQAWVAEMAITGMSGSTVRKNHGVLSSILQLAVREKRIPNNPSDGLNLPALNEKRRRYLNAEQVSDLADAAGDHRLVILVLAYCGLRWSEMAGLHVSNVNLLRRRLDIAQAVVEVDGARLAWNTPKNHERRSVPLPRFLVDELAVHLRGRSPEDLVFTSPQGGVLRNRNARRDWFNPAAAAIDQPGFVPHELRHTAASLAVSAGANVKAIQRMLGHASAAMTLDRYADLFDDDLDAVADHLDAIYERSSSRATLQAPILLR